jgi:hypothetical protein
MNKFNPYPSHLSVTKDTRDEKKERLASPRRTDNASEHRALDDNMKKKR